jgi:HK97 gp10 family phage protein
MQITISGDSEIIKALEAMGQKAAKKIVNPAVKKGIEPIAMACRVNAVMNVGGEMGKLISENIIVKGQAGKKKSYIVSAMINPAEESFIHITKGSYSVLGGLAKGKRYYIPSAIEFGHSIPGNGGTGSKDIPAYPFMRPAFDANIETCKKIIEGEVRNGLAKKLT